MKRNLTRNIKIGSYTLLFLFVMIVDQRILTSSNLIRSAFRQALALPFLIIILIQMNIKKLEKIQYYIYILIAAIITLILALYMVCNKEFFLQYCILLIEIAIVGFILLYIILNRMTLIKKEVFLNRNSIFWCFLLFLMGISNYNGKWPWEVLIVFILFLIFNISKKEQELLLRGMIYGIMLSYFIIQGSAFVFRPYDTIRYKGLYNNVNMNALFYVVVFVAYIINQYLLNEKKEKKGYKIINFILLISVFCFTILTISKAALITEVIILFLYYFYKMLKKENKIIYIVKECGIWICTTIFMLPICFSLARYLPPVFHHSVWFYGEYSIQRVHSFDAYNSEKYPKVKEVANLLLNRYLGIDEVFQINYDVIEETVEKVEEKKAIAGDGSDSLHPLYVEGEASNSYSARIGIWKEYINRINLQGHKIEEPHFWLTENYYILHAHNLFLEFTYNFGLIVGALFFIGYAVSAIHQFVRTIKSRDSENFAILTIFLILGVFGMFELDWYIGQAPLTFFFFMLCNMIWKENNRKILLKGEKKIENKNS